MLTRFAWRRVAHARLVVIAHDLVNRAGLIGLVAAIRLGRTRIHLHSWRQLQLARSDNHFAGLNAIIDHSEITLDLARFYLAQFQARIRFDDDDIWPVLFDLAS